MRVRSLPSWIRPSARDDRFCIRIDPASAPIDVPPLTNAFCLTDTVSLADAFAGIAAGSIKAAHRAAVPIVLNIFLLCFLILSVPPVLLYAYNLPVNNMQHPVRILCLMRVMCDHYQRPLLFSDNLLHQPHDIF